MSFDKFVSNPSRPSYNTAVTKGTRKVTVRSIAIQVRPKDIPGFQNLKYVGTESQYTGVQFAEDYDLLRLKAEGPYYNPRIRKSKFKPHERVHEHWSVFPDMEYSMQEAQMSATAALEEEKYVGPLLHGGAPEMIVSSGALGMTDTRQQPQTSSQYPTRKRVASEDINHTAPSRGHLKVIRHEANIFQPAEYCEEIEKKYDGPNLHDALGAFDAIITSSSSTPTTSERQSVKRNQSNSDPITESINRVINNTPIEEIEDPDFETMDYKLIKIDHTEEPAPLKAEEIGPEMDFIMKIQQEMVSIRTEQERIQKEAHEKALLRFKEIGRRFCELEVSDFSAEKSKNDRKTFMIASRGEEILASVKKNLAVIQEKLGEYAEGTIFEHVDALTTSFANVSPNAITRLNQLVDAKLKQNAAKTVSRTDVSSAATSSDAIDQLEEQAVKLEPPEYPEEELEYPSEGHVNHNHLLDF